MLVESGNRFVAFFDLLGFKSWIDDEGSREVFTYVRGFLNLMIRASLPGSVVHPDMSVDVKATNMGFINFSDSIVFYSRDHSDECLETMLKVSGEFMNGVICGPSRMIRGAVAHGEFYADPGANAYVGKALIDAYQLEEAQDWLSVGLHDSVVALPQFARARTEFPNYLVKALVPLRKSTHIPFCLNWADKTQLTGVSFNTDRGLDDCHQRALKALAGNIAETEKLRVRVEHTRAFLAHYNR
jgi:hypothetical protein